METKTSINHDTPPDAKHLLAVRVFNYEGRQLKLKTPDFCPYGSNGFDDYCHCNNCIDAITEMDGIKLGGVYFLKSENMNVKITSICPLTNCIDFGWERLPNVEKGKLWGSCMRADLT